ncbi:MAG TPA: hypothetical protein VFY95_10945 [Sphingomicrobium sp.]
MATGSSSHLTDVSRARGLRVAGLAIIILAAGAALLPAEKGVSSDVLGALLIAAGLIEMIAGSLRLQARQLTIAAGAITAIAGLLFITNPETKFFPTVTPIIGWLLIRSAIYGYASTRSQGSIKTWTALSAAIDLLLAALLIAGLSIAALVVSVFGPTPPLIASFSWVLAASFVVNGLLLLEVASGKREVTH